MKKIFILVAIALTCGLNCANAQDTYDFATYDGDNNVVMADEFQNATIDTENGKSVVTIDFTNVTMTAVGGTTPSVIDQDANVSEWNEIKWTTGNQSDIEFPYVQGTGNPYVKLLAEEIVTDGVPTGTYRAAYEYYEPDGSAGLPVSGLYYEFTPKVDGTLVLGVWINKGSRKLFVVDKETEVALTPNVDYTLGRIREWCKRRQRCKRIYYRHTYKRHRRRRPLCMGRTRWKSGNMGLAEHTHEG